jgi:hypothetical protein
MATAPKLATVQPQATRLEPGDILTPEQLAERLQVAVSWVYKSCAKQGANHLPVLRCGRYLRFSWPEVCAWLHSNNP